MFNDIYNFVRGLNKKSVFLILDINFFLTLLLLQNVHVRLHGCIADSKYEDTYHKIFEAFHLAFAST
ncbi:unnamed protein product [Acanthoscelides obtectus]|uniref:Uncharacterized protein n=1 Tax=Acanthoscelides obtectus TaxID=200917 RepID=A0A9P0QEZ9_ACAOB|nr:unnamed protein product [Acanthoscelides obtectus]CAH2018609.1 unnamed protein product [Acanthoscelides obtectus]CAK1633596.1 hypothetical protein AOBTE_LOCUS8247 [Acanthoscelides obtectus]CAK1688404.1 hypothetical protein AOBTE_LOCUS36710 [Acanthoscelides obtectus]